MQEKSDPHAALKDFKGKPVPSGASTLSQSFPFCPNDRVVWCDNKGLHAGTVIDPDVDDFRLPTPNNHVMVRPDEVEAVTAEGIDPYYPFAMHVDRLAYEPDSLDRYDYPFGSGSKVCWCHGVKINHGSTTGLTRHSPDGVCHVQVQQQDGRAPTGIALHYVIGEYLALEPK